MVFRRWVAMAGTLCLSGCNCGKGATPSLVSAAGVPQLPAQLAFGNVAVGQTLRLPLDLSNTGSGPLDLISQTVHGAAFSEPTAFVTSLGPTGRAQAILAFSPSQAGPATGTLTLSDDGDPATLSVALSGVGLALDVSATPASLDFGAVPVGTSAPPQSVTLENGGSAPIYVTLSTSGTASAYGLRDSAGQAVAAVPTQLAPGVPYVLSISFAPSAVSVFNSAFTFTPCEDQTADACLAPQPIALSGQGVSGQLALAPSPIVFTNVPAATSATASISITNVGRAAATLSCLYLESLGASACGAGSSAFTIGAPSQTLPATLPPGGTLTVPLTYHSTGTAAVTDTLEAVYTPQGLTAPVTTADVIQANPSQGACALSFSPVSLAFTYASASMPVTETVTASNGGGAPCQISGVAIDPASDPSYALAVGQAVAFSIAAGASATLGVTFDLANAGPPSTRLGHLDLLTNDPLLSSVQIPLTASIQTPYAGGGAWPRWHHDNTQSGLSPVDTSALSGNVAWTFSVSVPPPNLIGPGIQNDTLASPVVGSDGTIYQLGMNGTLYAVTPDGGLLWQTPLGAPITFDPHPGTPIIDSDGTLFVAFGETTLSKSMDALYHVSATGTVLSALPPANSGDGFDLPPLLTNGGLLLGADDIAGTAAYTPGAFAFQINANGTFNIVDSSNISSGFDQISAAVGSDDRTYWCTGGKCDALSPPGAGGFSELPGWPINPNGTQSATSDLAIDESFTGNLMILLGVWSDGSAVGAQQLVSVVPGTGKLAWSVTLPPPTAAQADVTYIGVADATVGNSCPAIGADGTVYVGNFDGLHAVNGATGIEKAGFPFPTTSDVLTAPAVGADGTIFFGTADGTFYAIHPDGSLRFKLTAGGRIAGSPAIGPSGAVYFTADDGFLYAVN